MGRLGRDPTRGGDSRAQPHLHVQHLPAWPAHRLVTDDGDRAWTALQCGARRPPHVSRRTVADRLCAAALLADAVACRRLHARVRRIRRACRARDRRSSAPTCGAPRPGCCFSCCATSSPRSSGRASCCGSAFVGIGAQRAAQLVADLRPFRPSGARTRRRRRRKYAHLADHVRRLDRGRSWASGGSAVSICSGICGGSIGSGP